MDRGTGGKRRGREKGGKIVRLIAVVWLLYVLGGVNAAYEELGMTGLTAFTVLADMRGSNADTFARTRETLVNIADEDQLEQWHDQCLTGRDSIGTLPKNMIVTKPVTLGLPDGRTNINPVETRAPEGPIRILAPKSLVQAGIVVDDLNLFITGTKNMISVEGEGCLILERGQIQEGASDKPATILRNQGTLVWEEGKDSEGPKKTDIRDKRIDPPGLIPSDESQTRPEYDDIQPQLTGAVPLNIGADGSGSARPGFKNLPSDISALYILRSEGRHSWEKEKNKATAASSQNGQEIVEYENFLKEAGDTLSTSIVADGYLIYRFQPGEGSFYVRAGIEWPGGSYETDKIRITIPEIVGWNLTFSYGGGNYSYGGRYADGYGSGFGGYGGGDTSGGDFFTQPGTQEESDALEGPVRGRGDRRRDSYTSYSIPGYKDGGTAAGRITEKVTQEATPSEARGPSEKDGDSGSQIQPAARWGDTDTAGQTEEGGEIMDTEPDPSRGEEEDSSTSGLKWYTGAVMLGCGIVCFYRRRRK